MEKDEYISIWKKVATVKKVYLQSFVGTNRRDACLWQLLETAVNNFLRKIAIVGRTDDISIALDDDKIWVQTSGKNEEDDFGLRKVTHVKDNRKGIIAHTAVNSSTIFPLGFLFERKGNRATDCFQNLFMNMFPASNFSDGNQTLPDLNGVINHSDRGYTLESTVFDFLLPAGSEFTNTVKRIAPFPFVWGMKVPDSDQREILDEKGAPALFIKHTTRHNRFVTCTAFRTGTRNVSAVLSSTIHGHQWEGICLSTKQRELYENDPVNGLNGFLFQRLASSDSLIEQYWMEIDDLLEDLNDEQINVLTLDQGTADWHKGRQFSMTSSQSSRAFRMAFILFQENIDWCNVAQYLYGEKYYERK